MLATLRNLFALQAVAQSLKTLPPLQSTIMDTYFKSRLGIRCRCSESQT